MRSLLIAAAAAVSVLSPLAHAQSVVATSNIIVRALDRSLDFTSDTTTSIRDMKVVAAAREDAASFVASQGDIRGAHLQAALTHIRAQQPQLQASDMQIAEAILAQ